MKQMKPTNQTKNNLDEKLQLTFNKAQLPQKRGINLPRSSKFLHSQPQVAQFVFLTCLYNKFRSAINAETSRWAACFVSNKLRISPWRR